MATTVGQLSARPINAQTLDSGLTVMGEFKEEFPVSPERKKFRYVRETMNGSDMNGSSHWLEMQVFSKGKNISAGKTVTANDTPSIGKLTGLTDGKIDNADYISLVGKRYIQIDLGDSYEIDEIKVWHYYNDGRTYKEVLLQVSDDLVNWYTVFDGEKDGRYKETNAGKTHVLPKFGLHSHVDFRYGSTTGYQRKNMIDFSEITKKTPSTITELTNFGASGNSIFTEIESPFFPESEVMEPVIQTRVLANNTASSYNGGFHTRQYAIDNTKTYRVTCLYKKDVVIGSTYLGMTTGSNVTSLTTETINSNPYFTSFRVDQYPELNNGEWFYIVYYVHPVGYKGTTHTESGVYKLDGTKMSISGADFRWSTTSTTAGIRAYLYYSTNAGDTQWFARPTFEEVDTTTVPIDYILYGGTPDSLALDKQMPNHLEEEGAYFTRTATNLSNGNVNIYNNYSIPYTLVTLPDETYNGFPITRITFTPTTDAHLNGLNGALHGTGVVTATYATYKASTKYCVSLYMRKVSHHNMQMGGTASNINGWTANKIPCTDGWERHYQTRNGTVVESKTDGVFFSIKTTAGEVKLGDKVVFDVCGAMIEEGFMYPSKPVAGSKATVKNILTLPKLKPPFTINLKAKVLRPSGDMGTAQEGYPVYLQMGTYYGNNSITLWRYGAKLSLYVKGSVGTGWSISKTWDVPDSEVLNKSVNYTLVARNTKDFDVYMNGVLKYSATSTEVVGELPNIQLNGYNTFGMLAEEISVYDYAMDSGEVNRTIRNTFSITKDGDVYDSRVVEGDNDALPHFHFPLAHDYMDTMGAIQLTTNTVSNEFTKGKLYLKPTAVGSLESDYLPLMSTTLEYVQVSTTSTNTGAGYVTRGYLDFRHESPGTLGKQLNNSRYMFNDGKSTTVAEITGAGKPTTASMYYQDYKANNSYYITLRVRRADGGSITSTNTLLPYFNSTVFSGSPYWQNVYHEGDGWYLLTSNVVRSYIPSGFIARSPYSVDYQNNSSVWGNKFIEYAYYGVTVNSGVKVYVDTMHLYSNAYSGTGLSVLPRGLSTPLNVNMVSNFNLTISSNFTVTYETNFVPNNTQITNVIGSQFGSDAGVTTVYHSISPGNYFVVVTYDGSTKTFTQTFYSYTGKSFTSASTQSTTISNTGTIPTMKLNYGNDSMLRNLKVYPHRILSYSELKDTMKNALRVDQNELKVHHYIAEEGD